MYTTRPAKGMAPQRQVGGVGVNFLTEDGFYVLRKLTPEEVFQILCELPDEPTEMRLDQLKSELSQEKLEEAMDSIIQEVYDDKDKSRDPLRADDSKYIRKYTWKRVKKLYQKLKLFRSVDEKVEMNKPTPKLESEKTRHARKMKEEKTKKENRHSHLFRQFRERARDEILKAGPQPAQPQPEAPQSQPRVTVDLKMLEEIADSVLRSETVCTKEAEGASACEEAPENQPEPVEPQPENVEAEPQEREEESEEEGSLVTETCGAPFKAAGACMLRKNLDTVQRPSTPRRTSGGKCFEKIKAAHNKILHKSAEEALIQSDTESEPSENTEVTELKSQSCTPGFRRLCAAKIRAGRQPLWRRGKKSSPIEIELSETLESEGNTERARNIKLMAQKLQFYSQNVKEYVQKLKCRSNKVKIVFAETQYQLKTATALLEEAAHLLEAANSSPAAEKLQICTNKLKAWTTKLKSLAEDNEQQRETSCRKRIRARIQQLQLPKAKAVGRTVDVSVRNIKQKVQRAKSCLETNLLKSIYKNLMGLLKVIIVHHRALLREIWAEGPKKILKPVKLGHLKFTSCSDNLKLCAGKVSACRKTSKSQSGTEPSSGSGATTTCISRLCSKKSKIGSLANIESPEVPDEAEEMKALLKESVLKMISIAVVESGLCHFSKEFSFPVADFVERIWNYVKDDGIQMDKAKITNKLHKLVYKDLIKLWKKSQFLVMFIQSDSSVLNEIVASTFVKHLKKLEKPSAFRRFLNFFHRKSR